MGILDGTTFTGCKFTGLFKNIILRDAQGEFKNMGTQFSNCDMEGLVFDNISIYGKNLFVNTKLPIGGLRLYANTNDSLIHRAKEICSKIDEDYKRESEVLFNEEIHSGQNPIIFDDLMINSFFKNDESRGLFDEIVNGYEIKTISS